MEELNLEVTSEFLIMASTLLYIKSKLLLPKPEVEEEEDPRADLAQRLLEYKKYKEASQELRKNEFSTWHMIFKESATLSRTLPATTENFCVGGDNRSGNAQYFKGTIYSVNIFNDVRTAEEIALDAKLVTSDTEGLVYSRYY